MTIYDPQNSSHPHQPPGMVIDAEVAAEVRKIRGFQIGLEQQTPRIIMTWVFVALNAIMFAVMAISGVSIASPKGITLLQWGANHGLLSLNGDWWRLLTCTVIHIGLLHFFVNVYSLYAIGPMVEKLFQPSGFFAIYFLSAIGGSLASVWWHPNVISAGASGALFGVFGGLMGYAFRQRHSLPHSVFVRLRNNGVIILGLNALFGLSIKGIDMAAHTGGMVVGFLVALVVALPVGQSFSKQRQIRSLIVTLAGTALLAGAYMVLPRTAVNKPLELIRMRQLLSPSWNNSDMKLFRQSLLKFGKAEKTIMEQFKQVYVQVATRQLSEQVFLQKLEKEILPAWKKTRALFSKYNVNNLAAFAQTKHKLLLRYVQLKEDYLSLSIQSVRTKDPKLAEKTQKKQLEVSKLLQQLNKL